MTAVNKKTRIDVRLTYTRKRDVVRAARILSKERGERVTPSALIRELAMPGIEKILSRELAGV